jgi:hypothetical protein
LKVKVTTPTENLLSRLIDQLNTLVPFLALAHRDVFNLIKREHSVWFSLEAERSLPESYSVYRRNVTHGAFLLGYSYSEAFLSDLLRDIYLRNPRMLPEDKQLTFGDLRGVRSYRAVMCSMVSKEVNSVFRQSMDAIAEYFERKLSLPWLEGPKREVIRASLLRNCILHNSAIVDSRLARVADYHEGNTITLEPEEVHSYGLSVRALAPDLYARAEAAFLCRKR